MNRGLGQMRSAIIGLAGPELSPAEARLLHALPPAGVILFARNIEDPPQLSGLVASLRQHLDPEAVLMVDQEGGRVARLRPPHWCAHPPAARLGRLFADNAARGLRASRLTGALIGLECRRAGFDVVAAPVLDLGLPGAHNVIGDRAFAADPEAVAQLGRAFATGLLVAGIQPVMKHMPGHGRAEVDSHTAMPRVESASLAVDLVPFVANVGLPWAMTAHILYPAWDAERPATLSPTIIRTIIRGRARFTGVLVTDDLAMGALSGEPATRAAGACAAGVDLALYCGAEPAANEAVLAAVPGLMPATRARFTCARAMATAAHRPSLDFARLLAERNQLLDT